MIARAGAASHRGLVRPANEDAYLAESPVFLVADGMGGHEAGEVASALAVTAFSRLVGPRSLSPQDVRAAFDSAYREISTLVQDGPLRAGTTVSGVAIADEDGEPSWLVFNLGDSRTYRLSHGVLEQLTSDHSVVQELIDAGALAPEAAATHPGRNVITRALGAGGEYRPDYWLIPMSDGDRILICSDGISNELDADALTRILLEEREPQAAADRLVAEGILRGARDNLTAVVVDVSGSAG